jgi:hypothetical protein
MSADAQSFDAKLAQLVVTVREMIFIDLDAYPADDDIIHAELKQTITKLACGQVNRCLGCGVDMGDCNPRQYCKKTYCPNK